MSVPESPRPRTIGGASVRIFPDRESACRTLADELAELIDRAVANRGRAVLGLATGSTPIPAYARLVELSQAGRARFDAVTTFNLDEYYPISPADPNSYRMFMHRHLLGKVGIAANRGHLLDGSVPADFAARHAADYDRWIAEAGGLDVQILGLGRNGHIGFNEPSDLGVAEAMALPTRLVDLHPTTIADAARDFGGEAHVPRQALTVGVAPILTARSIRLLAFGGAKADAVARSLQGEVTAEVPGSLLQTAAGRVEWYLDPASAAKLG